MRKLLLFLARYSIVGLFLILGTISFALFLHNNKYPQSVFFSSSNKVVSYLYHVSSSVFDFFSLRSENERLLIQNTDLKNKIAELENRLAIVEELNNFDIPHYIYSEKEYIFIPAKIIHNSTNKIRNFITLNKGERDGIRPDMGVVSAEGVVGIVKTVSNRFSVVISILNSMSQISSKIARNNQAGPLVWSGEDYRYATLTDIPRHVELFIGDSIVTSGLTTIFPANIPIGVIESFTIGEGDAFYSIKVRLAVDFRTVSNVSVFDYKNYEEQIELENENVQMQL
jgi:rod shape-determining protein MreC